MSQDIFRCKWQKTHFRLTDTNNSNKRNLFTYKAEKSVARLQSRLQSRSPTLAHTSPCGWVLCWVQSAWNSDASGHALQHFERGCACSPWWPADICGIFQSVRRFITSLFCFLLAVALPGPPGPPGQPGIPGSRNLVSIVIKVCLSFYFRWVYLAVWL